MSFIVASAVKGKAYEKFIKEAVIRSEYIQFDILHISGKSNFYNDSYIENLKKSDLVESQEYFDNFSYYHYNMLKGYADVLIPFVNNLGYELDKTNNQFNNMEQICMKTTKDMINTLYEPEFLMNWKAPCYPENLKFIKNGMIWFSYRTYENQAELFIDSDMDFVHWKQIGMKIKESCYKNVNQNKMTHYLMT